MDAQTLLAMDARDLLPEPPALDADGETWDAFMIRQTESIHGLLESVSKSLAQGVVTRQTEQRHEKAIWEFDRRLMVAAVKNPIRHKGEVLPTSPPGSALRRYIPWWEDIPEVLPGMKGRKEWAQREGDLEALLWLESMEKAFAVKRRQWFNKNKLNVLFEDPSTIDQAIVNHALVLAEDEVAGRGDQIQLCGPVVSAVDTSTSLTGARDFIEQNTKPKV